MTPLDEIELLQDDIGRNQERLIELAQNSDPEVRLRSIELLSELDSSDLLLELFRKCASDEDELVRFVSVRALEDSADTASVSVFLGCLEDSDWLVRGQAAIALAKTEHEEFVREIDSRLARCDNSEECVRYLIARFILAPETDVEIRRAFLKGGYRERCAIAHLWVDAAKWVREDSLGAMLRVREFLLDQSGKPQKASVRSSLDSALRDIAEWCAAQCQG